MRHCNYIIMLIVISDLLLASFGYLWEILSFYCHLWLFTVLAFRSSSLKNKKRLRQDAFSPPCSPFFAGNQSGEPPHRSLHAYDPDQLPMLCRECHGLTARASGPSRRASCSAGKRYSVLCCGQLRRRLRAFAALQYLRARRSFRCASHSIAIYVRVFTSWQRGQYQE